MLESGELARKPQVGVGVFADKDLLGILEQLDRVAASYLAMEAQDPDRALDVARLTATIRQNSPVPVLERQDPTVPLLVTGSLSLYPLARQMAAAHKRRE